MRSGEHIVRCGRLSAAGAWVARIVVPLLLLTMLPGAEARGAVVDVSAADTVKPAVLPTAKADTAKKDVKDVFAAVMADSARVVSAVDSVMRSAKGVRKPRGKFIPDPKRALWLALVIPGAGQIYNRKYWKLPIFYGGFLGCTYALMWNQQMYKDYAQAYIDIMDDDPRTASYKDMLPPGYDITGQEERFQTVFKNKKDRYRRWRDYAAFSCVGVYILSVIDAYVDAQLSVFDISKDLSLNVNPTVITVHQQRPSSAVGIGCGFNF